MKKSIAATLALLSFLILVGCSKEAAPIAIPLSPDAEMQTDIPAVRISGILADYSAESFKTAFNKIVSGHKTIGQMEITGNSDFTTYAYSFQETGIMLQLSENSAHQLVSLLLSSPYTEATTTQMDYYINLIIRLACNDDSSKLEDIRNHLGLTDDFQPGKSVSYTSDSQSYIFDTTNSQITFTIGTFA